jgi:hypothetical protein
MSIHILLPSPGGGRAGDGVEATLSKGGFDTRSAFGDFDRVNVLHLVHCASTPSQPFPLQGKGS